LVIDVHLLAGPTATRVSLAQVKNNCLAKVQLSVRQRLWLRASSQWPSRHANYFGRHTSFTQWADQSPPDLATMQVHNRKVKATQTESGAFAVSILTDMFRMLQFALRINVNFTGIEFQRGNGHANELSPYGFRSAGVSLKYL